MILLDLEYITVRSTSTDYFPLLQGAVSQYQIAFSKRGRVPELHVRRINDFSSYVALAHVVRMRAINDGRTLKTSVS